MVPVKAPPNLPSLVRAKFGQALQDGDIHYYPTQVTILTANSIPFQLRFSPALANKPKAPPSASASSKPPFNPFLSPLPALTITSLPTHNLVLNKFAIVPEHFILATKEVKSQTDLLEEGDLEAARACIAAYEGWDEDSTKSEEEDGLFAFFNCGEHSGASQPHRHIQLLPIARMKDGLPSASSASPSWTLLADSFLSSSATVPFRTFVSSISPSMSSAEVHDTYLSLYTQAVHAVYEHQVKQAPEVKKEGDSLISYNMAMTKTTLAICPRLAEGAEITNQKGEDVGKLALNGTLLAGTALVKSEAEWTVLRDDPDLLLQVLRKIGVPR